MYVTQMASLTLEGAMVILQGAIDKARSMEVPQSVAIVDAAGNLLAFARMDGAKILSQFSAIQKAVTAASSKSATGEVADDFALKLSLATGNRFVNLKGGLPIVINDQIVGAIGVGSGTGEQDVEVAQAGISALTKLAASL
jgi:glc operon protein GlcG